jgi:cytochrome c oxidase subunit 5a
MSASLLRVAAVRGSASATTTTFFRANALRPASATRTARAAILVPGLLAGSSLPANAAGFSSTARMREEHAEETFEEFTARYATRRDTTDSARDGKAELRGELLVGNQHFHVG